MIENPAAVEFLGQQVGIFVFLGGIYDPEPFPERSPVLVPLRGARSVDEVVHPDASHGQPWDISIRGVGHVEMFADVDETRVLGTTDFPDLPELLPVCGAASFGISGHFPALLGAEDGKRRSFEPDHSVPGRPQTKPRHSVFPQCPVEHVDDTIQAHGPGVVDAPLPGHLASSKPSLQRRTTREEGGRHEPPQRTCLLCNQYVLPGLRT